MKEERFYYKIAEQIGNKGIYGEIELQCVPNYSSDKVEVILAEEYSKFNAGICFGITYFIENCTSIKGMKVNVISIKSNPVDTNNLVMAYITFFALYKGLELEVKQIPVFIKENASFVFMK
jgi:hypothetical protein